MEHLSERDLRSALEFVNGVYATRELDSFDRYILERLPELIPSDIAACSKVQPATITFCYQARPHGSRECLVGATYVGEHFWQGTIALREHPLVRNFLLKGRSDAHRFSDFLTPAQFHRSEMYRLWYQHIRLEDVLGVVFPDTGKSLFQIVVGRGRQFSEKDKSLFAAISKHLFQAYRNLKALKAALEGNLAAEAAVTTRSSYGVIVLAKDGNTLFATSHCDQWLDNHFEKRESAGRLPDSLSRWVREQERLQTGGALDHIPEPLVVDRGEQLLVVRLLLEADHRILVLEKRESRLTPAKLNIESLSKRENEVLALIASGRASAQIADFLGISRQTVKKHLEHIYIKLGVRGRAAAVTFAQRALRSN